MTNGDYLQRPYQTLFLEGAPILSGLIFSCLLEFFKLYKQHVLKCLYRNFPSKMLREILALLFDSLSLSLSLSL